MRLFDMYRMNTKNELPFPGLYTRGNNGYGQLGLGDTNNRTILTCVGTATNWVDIIAGRFSTYALNSDGELYACGRNSYGQLGLGDTNNRTILTRVGTATNWVKIIVDEDYVLSNCFLFAINSDGELYACGKNYYGRLGLGDTDNQLTLTRVGTASNWVDISCFQTTSYALNSDGELYACGENDNGQLGLGDTNNRTILTRVGTATNWVKIRAGLDSIYALNSDGELYACGRNDNGQLGLGDADNRTILTHVGTATNWVDIIAGSGPYMHALNSDGELYACGNNGYGQLGLGDTNNRTILTRVGTATNWVKIGGKGNATYAVNSGGELYVCGDNYYGRLGLGDTDNRTTLTRVGTATNWVDAIMSSGYCLGAINSHGHIYMSGYGYTNTLAHIAIVSKLIKFEPGYYSAFIIAQ